MITIVTGNINSLKTTRLKAHYDARQLGDGFLCLKTMMNDLVHHYDLYRLSTKEQFPFIIREDFYQNEKKIRYQMGPYLFYDQAFKRVEGSVEVMIKAGVSPIYLDEIGLLELKNQGFHHILMQLLHAAVDLCLVIRSDLLDKVIEKYQIEDYEIVGD
ncbi:MAG TPA: nucleoside-triphosphatase [Candidatus Izemoplasmatales bacterium]|nr:nucleoside-triphosphatase [Candidatus Izemoplasmatales bacterium]